MEFKKVAIQLYRVVFASGISVEEVLQKLKSGHKVAFVAPTSRHTDKEVDMSNYRSLLQNVKTLNELCMFSDESLRAILPAHYRHEIKLVVQLLWSHGAQLRNRGTSFSRQAQHIYGSVDLIPLRFVFIHEAKNPSGLNLLLKNGYHTVGDLKSLTSAELAAYTGTWLSPWLQTQGIRLSPH